MASEGDLVTTSLEAVRIPVELNAGLDRFFSALKLGILDKAVHRASKRKTDDEKCIVSKEDVLTSAGEALAAAASELEQALTTREPRHVRKAS